MNDDFTTALLAWFDSHGRKQLPWKRGRDPYPIWVSEIMLQQTQVGTVIPYFERFLARFPDVASLARAELDEVLHLWTGLGYYARARNLHRAARVIVDDHGGQFPADIETLNALPGIGRSTAAAILAFSTGQRHTILDGNVKRVLTRYHAVVGWPGAGAVETELWALAQTHTPTARVADYTQAIMDLGATLCRRSKPLCPSCPVATGCAARAQGKPEAYPAPAPRRKLPVRSVAMLMIRNPAGQVLLEQRPPQGIWGGLWGLPECADEAGSEDWCRDTLGMDIAREPSWPVLRHTFSHFHLDITPIPAQLTGARATVMEYRPTVWYNPAFPDARGLAAPVQKLLQRLRIES